MKNSLAERRSATFNRTLGSAAAAEAGGGAVQCPVCGSGNCFDLGQILHPEPTTVAGVRVHLGDATFRLFRCESCAFSFKSPRVSEQQLLESYAKADASHWQLSGTGMERRFDQIETLVSKYAPGPRLLDIGCFSGELLGFMGSGWTRFGVEPNRRAADEAERRGVTMLGATVLDIPSGSHQFDAVLAIDVVEHLVDPRSFFDQVTKLLSPGGILVVLTGNTRALTWRLQRSRYWYCSLPEHVSFYCTESLDYIAQSCRLASLECKRLSHNRWRLRDRLKQTVKNLGYAGVSRVNGFRIPALRPVFVARRAPNWMSGTDHILYAMKNGESTEQDLGRFGRP